MPLACLLYVGMKDTATGMTFNRKVLSFIHGIGEVLCRRNIPAPMTQRYLQTIYRMS